MKSIQRTFPLFVTALLVAVAIVQLTVGYVEVRPRVGGGHRESGRYLLLYPARRGALMQPHGVEILSRPPNKTRKKSIISILSSECALT